MDKKLRRKGTLEKEIKGVKEARADPADMFATGYGAERDENGIPTHDAAGNELKRSAKDKLKKEFQRRQKARETYLMKLEADPAFFEKLQQEMEEIQAFLAEHNPSA